MHVCVCVYVCLKFYPHLHQLHDKVIIHSQKLLNGRPILFVSFI